MVSKNRPYGPHRNWRLAVVFGSFRAYERDLKAELLGSPGKRLLKKDAIPTIFVHRPSKKPRLSTEKRMQEKAKREGSLRVNVLIHSVYVILNLRAPLDLSHATL